MSAKQRQVIDAFTAAGRDLQIDVVAPFDAVVDGRSHQFLAFLPHFGGPKGMVVAASLSDHAAYAAADECGYYISFVNADVCSTYGREHFIDTLNAWGSMDLPRNGFLAETSSW